MYYQYEDDSISACPLTIHTLLHIADGIKLMGPVWVYWAFAMERSCGKLARMIILAQAQLQHIVSHHNIHDQLALWPPSDPGGTIIAGPHCRYLFLLLLVHGLKHLQIGRSNC